MRSERSAGEAVSLITFLASFEVKAAPPDATKAEAATLSMSAASVLNFMSFSPHYVST
jgi:hypothetical protein